MLQTQARLDRPEIKRQEKPRIVIVDDEPDFLRLAREWLRGSYDVITFLSGDGLVDELRAFEPDVVILDVRMPDIDGFELCHQIRDDDQVGELPVLFLTASQSDTDYIKHMFVGGTRYLNKPIG